MNHYEVDGNIWGARKVIVMQDNIGEEVAVSTGA